MRAHASSLRQTAIVQQPALAIVEMREHRSKPTAVILISTDRVLVQAHQFTRITGTVQIQHLSTSDLFAAILLD